MHFRWNGKAHCLYSNAQSCWANERRGSLDSLVSFISFDLHFLRVFSPITLCLIHNFAEFGGTVEIFSSNSHGGRASVCGELVSSKVCAKSVVKCAITTLFSFSEHFLNIFSVLLVPFYSGMMAEITAMFIIKLCKLHCISSLGKLFSRVVTNYSFFQKKNTKRREAGRWLVIYLAYHLPRDWETRYPAHFVSWASQIRDVTVEKISREFIDEFAGNKNRKWLRHARKKTNISHMLLEDVIVVSLSPNSARVVAQKISLLRNSFSTIISKMRHVLDTLNGICESNAATLASESLEKRTL